MTMARATTANVPASNPRRAKIVPAITDIVVIDETAPSSAQPIRRPNRRRVGYRIRQIAVIWSSRYSNAPAIVATPFPPLNFRNGVQQCPATAASPRDQRNQTGSVDADRIATATAPLDKSPMSATPALPREETRRTLLKPGFPDPAWVTSMPVPQTAITAKGIAPMRKLPAILRTTSQGSITSSSRKASL